MAFKVRLDTNRRRTRGLKDPVLLEPYELHLVTEPTKWLSIWRKLVSHANNPGDPKGEDSVRLMTDCIQQIANYVRDLTRKCRAIPPAVISDAQVNLFEEADWCDQLHDQLLLVQGIGAIWKDVLKPERTRMEQEGHSPVYGVVLGFVQMRDTLLWEYFRHVFKEWGINRRDDIVGAMDDGYWPPSIREGVFALVSLIMYTWNSVLITDESPFNADLIALLEKTTVPEFGKIYDAVIDRPSAADDRFRAWFLCSEGLPLLPPPHAHALYIAREIPSHSPQKDEYPWKATTYIQPPLRPWNRSLSRKATSLPVGKLTIGAWWRLLDRIWNVQDDLVWAPYLEAFVLIGLWHSGIRFILAEDGAMGTSNPELVSDLEGEDLIDLDGPRKQWILRIGKLHQLERWFMHLSRLNWMKYTLMRRARAFCLDAEQTTLLVPQQGAEDPLPTNLDQYRLTKQEANRWCVNAAAKVMSYRESTAANAFKDAVSTVSLGYVVRPMDLEEYVVSRGAIAVRRPLQVLGRLRSAEFRSIVTLVFDSHCAINTLTYACVSDEIGLTRPDKFEDTSTGLSVDASTAALVKYQVYHRTLPVLLQEIVQMEELHRTASSTIASAAKTASTNRGIPVAVLHDLQREFNSVAREYLAELERVHPGIKATLSLDDGEAGELEKRFAKVINRNTGVGDEIDPRLLFPSRFHVPHYSLRSYTTRDGINAKEHAKELRGAVPPNAFSNIFFGNSIHLAGSAIFQPPVKDGTDIHKLAQVVCVRGEYWVISPDRFFGRTRCLEQALKWYALETRHWGRTTGGKSLYCVDAVTLRAFASVLTA